ncbi:MAG: S8 family serine peptidase, partial [Solirubrobacteraceae bacterium]
MGPTSSGGWENNNITALSSDGTTEFSPATVSVVAPGDRGWSLCSSDTAKFFGCADIDHGANPPPIWAAGGTSASAPETSGTAALVMQAYAKTNGGALPSPALVKQIIVSTAQDLGAPADRQGAGLVNTLKAVQLAESINGGSPQGNTLL